VGRGRFEKRAQRNEETKRGKGAKERDGKGIREKKQEKEERSVQPGGRDLTS